MEVASRSWRCERTFVAVEDTLDHPEHVGGAEDYANCGGDCPPWLTPEKVLERMRNSPMKPFSMGRPIMARETMTKRVARRGTLAGEAAVCGDLAGGVADFESAEENEEGGVDEFVVEDLVGSAPSNR